MRSRAPANGGWSQQATTTTAGVVGPQQGAIVGPQQGGAYSPEQLTHSSLYMENARGGGWCGQPRGSPGPPHPGVRYDRGLPLAAPPGGLEHPDRGMGNVARVVAGPAVGVVQLGGTPVVRGNEVARRGRDVSRGRSEQEEAIKVGFTMAFG